MTFACADIRITNNLLTSTWAYDWFNTVTLGISEEVIAYDKVCAIN